MKLQKKPPGLKKNIQFFFFSETFYPLLHQSSREFEYGPTTLQKIGMPTVHHTWKLNSFGWQKLERISIIQWDRTRAATHEFSKDFLTKEEPN